MIRKIGVIYQDSNSFGFLEGLKERLGCEAELIPPPTAIGMPSVMPRRTLKLAWNYFQKQGVDLIVRLTDADDHRWQEVRRTELSRVPDGTGERWIFGVAVECIEDWLALDPQHLAEVLQLNSDLLKPSGNRVGLVKNALARARNGNENSQDVVARIVRDAPREALKRWLRDDAFKTFYSDCRAAATRADCETNNDMEEESG